MNDSLDWHSLRHQLLFHGGDFSGVTLLYELLQSVLDLLRVHSAMQLSNDLLQGANPLSSVINQLAHDSISSDPPGVVVAIVSNSRSVSFDSANGNSTRSSNRTCSVRREPNSARQPRRSSGEWSTSRRRVR